MSRASKKLKKIKRKEAKLQAKAQRNLKKSEDTSWRHQPWNEKRGIKPINHRDFTEITNPSESYLDFLKRTNKTSDITLPPSRTTGGVSCVCIQPKKKERYKLSSKPRPEVQVAEVDEKLKLTK